MRDAFLDLTVGGRCLGCRSPGRSICPRCSATLPAEAGDAFLARPDPMPAGMVPAVAAAAYDGLVRRMILAHKDRQSFGLVRPLGSLLGVALTDVLAGWPARVLPVLVPVPSRTAKVRARGHDPLGRIVRTAAGSSPRGSPRPVPVVLLRQRVRIRDQRALDAVGRAENLAEAFAVEERVLRRLAASQREVAAIICDDVLTTGSTAREAQRALESVGVPVAAIVVVAATRLRRTG